MFEILKQFQFALGISSVFKDGLIRPACKATPDLPSWPSSSSWQRLNSSVAGRLIRPNPPGAVCHLEHPAYDPTACAIVQARWPSSTFHADDPVSVDWGNWNNDSCLPYAQAPCSGDGYPIYVVNASTPQDVKAGVDFAREHNVRLIVKTSGHDAMGRSSAPNSLSIWLRHMGDTSFSSNFQPQGCKFRVNESSVTVGAGVLAGEIYRATADRNLTVVLGMAQDIGIGGYLTGGGHSAISPTYGLGADGVFEMEVVTPRGEILIVNECQNAELFWAMRGGGGSTFGVITSATLRTFPIPTMSWLTFFLKVPEVSSDSFWNMTTYFYQQMPNLVDAGVSGYVYNVPFVPASGPEDISGPLLFGGLAAVNQDATVLTAAFEPVVAYAKSIFPHDAAFTIKTSEFNSYYDWWFANRDSSAVGADIVLGSRLLSADALLTPFDELKHALKTAAGPGGIIAHIVSGKGVWNAKPRGGSNAINPAWRNGTVVHLVTGVGWPPLNPAARDSQLAELKQKTEELHKLSPYSGGYLNEANPNEPDYQGEFWGNNYPRLLAIKKKFDPEDVFWCHPCVGNEGWKEEGRKLCRV